MPTSETELTHAKESATAVSHTLRTLSLLRALLILLLSAAPAAIAGWLKPGDDGRLATRQVCAVNLQWLDAGRGADPGQLSHLEHDGRLVTLEAGTQVVDQGSMVWPPHPAATQLKVRSGPNRGAICWVDGPAPRVR